MSKVLLICSVGGTAEPIVASLIHWNPEKVYFIVSQETSQTVEKVMSAYKLKTGNEFSQGAIDYINVSDPEALVRVVGSIRSVSACAEYP